MKNKLLIISFLLVLPFILIAQNSHTMSDKEWKKAMKYIPHNIEEAMLQLDIFYGDSVKIQLLQMDEPQFLAETHMWGGVWIRNNWGLWKKSVLKDYFIKKGIPDADMMSGVIFKCYYNHLHGEPINFESNVESAKKRLRKMLVPVKGSFPKEVGKPVEFRGESFAFDNDKGEKVWMHIAADKKRKEVWLYNYTIGWKKTDKETVENIMDQATSLSERYEIVKSIYNLTEINNL